MPQYNTTPLPASTNWKAKLLAHAGLEKHFALLDSRGYGDTYGAFDWLAGGGTVQICNPAGEVFEEMRREMGNNEAWWLGRLGYDVKNCVEDLHSGNEDFLNWPDAEFFMPQWVVTATDGTTELYLHRDSGLSQESWLDKINREAPQMEHRPVELEAGMSRDNYLERAQRLLAHIQRGDIYEVNFCVEFRAEGAAIDPVTVYHKLIERASPPFSALMRFDDQWIVSMSPERYLRKSGSTLISQPIKGTAPRGATPEEDLHLTKTLQNDPKERSENAMIVDLVRNDFSRVAARNSVEVPEFLQVHTFPTVHQLISTVRATLRPDRDLFDALKASFPMGSMTGAPKIRAMQLIEEFEIHKRGPYSGAIGYISPGRGVMDADFNVAIRTLFYDAGTQRASVSVGSALTHRAEPEKEWEECLWKLRAIKDALAE